MKKHHKRFLASLCALCITAGMLPAHAAGGSYSDSYNIAKGLKYTTASSETNGVRQQSFRLEYTPGQDIMPIVAYGNKLYGKSDINEIIDFVQKSGQSVYGAANADFFVLSTGLPSGLVVNNGRLVSSDGMWNAVGIKPDGKMIVGAPKMAMSMYSSVTGDYPVYALNKQRTDAGIYLLNSDYSSQTRSTGTGVNVVLKPLDDEPLQIGKDKQFTVAAVNTDVSGSTDLNEGEFILTATNAYNKRGYTITSLQVGETVTFRANVYNEAFADVVYACGAGDMVMKDGVMQSGLSTALDPRTLLGVREDGSAVALVHDGRLEISKGITVKEAAQLLANKGCTNIVNLDGGGSSAEAVRQPGSSQTEVVNTPSEGSLRKCANYILFVNTAPKTGEESGAFVYPHSVGTLKGAQITLGANTFDEHYYPVSSYTSGFKVTAPAEEDISGSVYTAPEQAGEYEISLDHPSATSMPAKITVYAQPDRVVVKNKGATVTSLSLDMGESVDLNIDAYAESRILYETDELFNWSVTNNAGTITQAGVFTASNTAGASGEIVITHNGSTTKIPVSVGKMPSIVGDFEKPSTYTTTMDNTAITGSAAVTASLDCVRYGKGALRLAYAGGKGMEKAGSIVYTADAPISISGAKNLTFFAKGTPAKAMFINFAMSDGSTEQRAFNAGEAWTLVTVNVPAGAQSIKSFSASIAPGESGSVCIDQIIAHYTAAQPDSTPPDIQFQEISTGRLVGSVTDASGFPISKANISVLYDGAAMSFTYNDQTGALEAQLPYGESSTPAAEEGTPSTEGAEPPAGDGVSPGDEVSPTDGVSPDTGDGTPATDGGASADEGGLHRLTVVAKDVFGNIARKSETIGTGSATTPFADMEEHWARDYAEYLRVQNVFSTDSNFMPQNNTTNEMAATLLSRYLGLDPAAYNDVKLPYTDAGKISGWALPHVRALYAKGIMIGGTDGKGNSVFQPAAQVTRAQVMTLLGRTLERGYAYSPAAYDDMRDVPAWAADHVNLLSSLGIINGYSGTNSIKPLAPITRAEFASLLFKLY